MIPKFGYCNYCNKTHHWVDGRNARKMKGYSCTCPNCEINMLTCYAAKFDFESYLGKVDIDCDNCKNRFFCYTIGNTWEFNIGNTLDTGL